METMAQRITSAGTSINKLPRLFNQMPADSALFERGAINVDIGGGRFEAATEFLHSKGVHSFVWDPFNRDEVHNDRVWELFIATPGRADTTTLSNVLNVIRHESHRISCLEVAARAVGREGVCFITVYEGNRSNKGRKTTKGFQLNRRTKDYVSEIENVFRDVEVARGRLIIARDARFVYR